MGLDENRTQHAGLAFDVHSSLIYIEAAEDSEHTLLTAAKRLCRHVRSEDSVLLLERVCVLLLPDTPFSGAQAVAGRISLLLTDVSYELQVYHGATALLILQRLREGGAETPNCENRDRAATVVPSEPIEIQTDKTESKRLSPDKLPYLAFLTNYPSRSLLHLLPYELACRYQCVPVGAERNMLTLATHRLLNYDTLTQLRSATQRGIFQVRCEMMVINEVLHYWQRLQRMPEAEHSAGEQEKTCSGSR